MLSVLRTLRRGRVPILCYHSITAQAHPALTSGGLHTTAAAFRQQLAYLTRHYRVLPLADLVNAIQKGCPLPRAAAVITFDDGYANTLEVAAPLLTEYGCPATVFLATGYVGVRLPFWWDEIAIIIAEAAGRRAEPAEWGAVALDSRAGVDSIRRQADVLLAGALPGSRRAHLDELRRALGVPRPDAFELALRPLRWEECLSAPTCLQFGGHTVTHRVLDRLSVSDAEQEIRQCAVDLRQLGDRAVPYFCYPAGRWTRDTRAALPSLGFIAGVDAQSYPGWERLAGGGDDPALLPRIGVAGGISLARFAAHVAGARAWGSRR
jgi:peptidoglycan/xylan/chitin deacetylase (PgdA/CDA1 family)